jgi:hypothetical protein
MKLSTTFGLTLAAALLPNLVLADDPVDPYAPNPAPTTQPAPQKPVPVQDPYVPQPPQPTTTTTFVTPAQPTPQSVIIVNPQPRAPRTLVIERDPETYTVTDSWNAPVFATGALIFVGSYGASAIVAGTSDHVGADRLYVPVVGPWLALDEWGHCPIAQPRCDENTTEKVLLVADGVFQAAGVITMLTGLLSPSTHTIVAASQRTSVKVRPTRNGVAAFGNF